MLVTLVEVYRNSVRQIKGGEDPIDLPVMPRTGERIGFADGRTYTVENVAYQQTEKADEFIVIATVEEF